MMARADDAGAAGKDRAGDEPAGNAPVERRTVLGKWEGIGVEDDDTRWVMQVDIQSVRAGPCARVAYPTMPCTATWVCTGDGDGEHLAAAEHITEGHGICADGGTMQMRLTPDGALEWTWSGAQGHARARLERPTRAR